MTSRNESALFLANQLTVFFFAFVFRTRKASITTGVVERTETLKNESVDRLSPLSNAANTFISFQEIGDPNNELEKFVDMDIDTQQQLVHTPDIAPDATYSQLGTNLSSGSTRRHTVGPGDVEHEQALAHPGAVPINFKFGADNANQRLPINLPMMQNQPLHNFTIKNQHLLKPPTVMEASKCATPFIRETSCISQQPLATSYLNFISISLLIQKGSFGRRASDGGANLQIYYPASGNSGKSVEPIYANPSNVKDLRIGMDPLQQQRNENMPITLECSDESNDEIQR